MHFYTYKYYVYCCKNLFEKIKLKRKEPVNRTLQHLIWLALCYYFKTLLSDTGLLNKAI